MYFAPNQSTLLSEFCKEFQGLQNCLDVLPTHMPLWKFLQNRVIPQNCLDCSVPLSSVHNQKLLKSLVCTASSALFASSITHFLPHNSAQAEYFSVCQVSQTNQLSLITFPAFVVLPPAFAAEGLQNPDVHTVG